MARSVRSLVVLLALTSAAVLAGCSTGPGTPPPASTHPPSTSASTSSASSTSSTEPPTTTSGTGTPTAIGRPVHSLHAGEADNGRTLTMNVGDELTVELTNTYWRFDDPAPPSVLRIVRPPSAGPLPTPHACPPGAGCGIVSVTYEATAPGTAVVAANRTSCGEALACTEAQAHYRLTVVVN